MPNDSVQIPVIKEILVKASDSIFISHQFNELFDKNYNVIQATKRGTGVRTSYLYGYNNKLLIAKISNSENIECGYTGFENNETNGWSISGNFTNAESYTGFSSIELNENNGPEKVFNIGLIANNHSGYTASVWVKKAGVSLNMIVNNDASTIISSENEADDNEWHLLKVVLDKDKFANLINSEFKIKIYIKSTDNIGYIDDLRFHPNDSQMITYTYDSYYNLSSETETNNKAIIYEYDDLGRLRRTRDFLGNILKVIDYSYKWEN